MSKFADDLKKGLNSENKYISSKYFYDKRGSELFTMIMNVPEYYLTKSEFEILENQSEQILDLLIYNNNPIEIIEFGAGDGLKTKLLLKEFLKNRIDFTYIPIDISDTAINQLEKSLKQEFPNIKVHGLNLEYFQALELLRENKQSTKLVLFLGSNIGNFGHENSISFLQSINENLNKGDMLLLGADLKKDPYIILDAYNDKQGITREFNLNILKRINREFDANFDIDTFTHYPIYNPQSGEARSFLISQKKQTVEIKKLNLSVDFDYAEEIFLEISKKYTLKELNLMALNSNFKILSFFFDCKHFFTDVLMKKEL